MYHAVNLKVIRDNLKNDFNSMFTKTSDDEIQYTGFMRAGDLLKSFSEDDSSKVMTKIVGILFCIPEVPFVKNEILPAIGNFHHLTSTHIDIYCAGFSAYLPPDELPDRRNACEVNGTAWEYSDKAFSDIKNEIEKISEWKHSNETELLLFEVEIKNGKTKFNFDKSLVLNLEKMKDDKAISSVRKLFNDLVQILKKNSGLFETSDAFGLGVFTDLIRNTILNTLPGTLKESYSKAEHFSIKNLSKKK